MYFVEFYTIVRTHNKETKKNLFHNLLLLRKEILDLEVLADKFCFPFFSIRIPDDAPYNNIATKAIKMQRVRDIYVWRHSLGELRGRLFSKYHCELAH